MTEPAQPTATKSAFAYLRLREMIVSGALAPGEVINQAVVAPRIGVSTTPLREALRRLEGEGLVRLGAHRDARVAPLTAQEAHDLLEMRRSLDPLAASLAAERRTDEDLEAMRAAADEIDALPDDAGAEALEVHRDFHTALYRASHNVLLIEVLDSLRSKADRYRRLALAEGGERHESGREADGHRRLLERVREGDADGAAELMRLHIDSSLDARALERLGSAEQRSLQDGPRSPAPLGPHPGRAPPLTRQDRSPPRLRSPEPPTPPRRARARCHAAHCRSEAGRIR